MDDEISTVCALLHDVVEDTDMTFENLIQMGYPQEVIEVLKLLTHEKEIPYMLIWITLKNYLRILSLKK